VTRAATGARAELAVVDYLTVRGFTILAQNLRLGRFELDIVAMRGGLVVVVEVRARGKGSYERPLESITPVKRLRLLRATERLLRDKLARIPGVERVRIDAAAVAFAKGGVPSVEYIEGAITA
jgi:putative endonuclease